MWVIWLKLKARFGELDCFGLLVCV